jgi:hypothetical protein
MAFKTPYSCVLVGDDRRPGDRRPGKDDLKNKLIVTQYFLNPFK